MNKPVLNIVLRIAAAQNSNLTSTKRQIDVMEVYRLNVTSPRARLRHIAPKLHIITRTLLDTCLLLTCSYDVAVRYVTVTAWFNWSQGPHFQRKLWVG